MDGMANTLDDFRQALITGTALAYIGLAATDTTRARSRSPPKNLQDAWIANVDLDAFGRDVK